MKKRKTLIFSSGLCLAAILVALISNLHTKIYADKQPHTTKNTADTAKEKKASESTVHRTSSREKPLKEPKPKQPSQKNSSDNISSAKTDNEPNELSTDWIDNEPNELSTDWIDIDDEMLLSAANLGETSRRFQLHKIDFYQIATEEQKSEGRKLLNKLRSTIKIPDNLQFRTIFTKKDSQKPSYTCNGFFKSPHYYKEEASGESSYKYVTDGTFENTDYAADIINRIPGIVPRYVDKNVFLEMFPARIMLDSDLIWTGKKVVNSVTDGEFEVDVISNWLYDIDIRRDNHLANQLTFYDRNDRVKEIVRICNIEYKTFEINDPQTKIMNKYTLPVRYTIIYSDDVQAETYHVDMGYKRNLNEEIPQSQFYLDTIGK